VVAFLLQEFVHEIPPSPITVQDSMCRTIKGKAILPQQRQGGQSRRPASTLFSRRP
jgi:hypothetical protein